MRVSVITPTCDRPAGIALCERFMARQSFIPDEWIVADGGQEPAPLTMGQIHLHQPGPPGATNFCTNLLNAITAARGELVVVIEDDDHVAPDHLETLVATLEAHPESLLAGDDCQRYYNVAHRCWRTFQNVGASLCQTAMRRAAIPAFVATVRDCMARNSYGVDTNLWRRTPREQWALTGRMTVLGVKGLPGRAGLGIGHRPAGPAWTADPDLAQLEHWIGADAALYAGFAALAAA